MEAQGQCPRVKRLPVFLNSKEEIGWKVQPPNSNLAQEVV